MTLGLVTDRLIAQQRREAEAALQKAREELDARVAERTAELTRANAELQREVLERGAMVESLRASEEQFARTGEFSLVMVAQIGLDGRWLKVPPRLCRLLGYSEAELLAATCEEFTHPDDFARDRCEIQRLARGEIKSFEREKRCITKDGETLWTYQNCSIVLDGEDKPLHILAYIRDITGEKRREKQARESQKLKAIGNLAGGVAHSFNNLMMTVLGHSEIMLDGMRPGDAYFASAQEIKRSATRTATLTQKLSAFGRRQVLSLRTVDLNATVNGLAPVLRLLKDGVGLELNLEPRLALTKADPYHLEEALLTLARNACAAMPNGGRLTIQTANVELPADHWCEPAEGLPGPFVQLAITDTGVGMDREAVSRLFEPFYTQEAGVGAGLGLAAVYGFIKQIGGDISVRSEPGNGTTFRIYLPREAAVNG